PEDDEEAPAGTSSEYEKIETPSERVSKGSVVSMADIEKVSLNENEELREYRGANVLKYVLMRTVVIAILVVASVLLKDHFLDLTDFIGASAVSMNSIILPIMFYMKVLWKKIPLYEKVPALVVVVVCFGLGCYVTYTSGKNLFNPDEKDPEILFPFCHEEDQRALYWNASASGN
ncbi:hypothetical protein PybrP1_001059, partial [[Pythium] brassicae (nom. inval.)]